MRGWTNREIGRSMGKTGRAAAARVQYLFRKVGVHTRGELALWGLNHLALISDLEV